MSRHLVENRVVVRGAGELASGVIRRLATSDFEVIALEQPVPTFVRRHVCYAEALFKGTVTVAGITAVRVSSATEAETLAGSRSVPILVDPEARQVPALAPLAVVDGRMLKQGVDVDLKMAPIVIGLGPGFVVGRNCHAAVETNRGSDLGRILYDGEPRAYNGVPAAVSGYSRERVVRSPTDGEFTSCCDITDLVRSGQVLGEVAGVSVIAGIDGIVRGMIHSGLKVSRGQKIGDLDPRGSAERCYRMSGKAEAVGEAVLEAITSLSNKLSLQ
jgi:xanthine dehydrogenase accessory factor